MSLLREHWADFTDNVNKLWGPGPCIAESPTTNANCGVHLPRGEIKIARKKLFEPPPMPTQKARKSEHIRQCQSR